MLGTSRQKTIHYKNAFITGSHVLQDALKVAIGPKSKASKPKLRQQKTNQESDSVIFINRVEEYAGVTFGQLVTLEAGRAQRFITVDDDAEFYTIDAMTSDRIPDLEEKTDDAGDASKKAAKRREFLEAVLYFGVLGNHVILLQSAALRSNHLEAHLSWLLGTHTSVIPQMSMLALKDKAAEETFKKLKSAPVKKLRIGAPLTEVQSLDPSDIPLDLPPKETEAADALEGARAERVKFVPHGAGAAMLMAALKDGFFEKLNLNDSLDDANIQIALEVTYLRKTTTNGHKVLDSIAASLRHLADTDLTIELEGGGRITGEELKLSGRITVEFLPNGLINEALLFNAMQQWLAAKISSAEIDPTS